MIARGWQYCGILALFVVAQTLAQSTKEAPQTARRGLTPLERSVLDALSADPATAPYRIATDLQKGRLVLKGRVATHTIHDLVVQTALAFTPNLDDELVIATSEAARALEVPQIRARSEPGKSNVA